MKTLETNKDYWNEMIRRYQIGKRLRLYMGKHGFTYLDMQKIMGFKRQYIYGVEQIEIKPNENFITKLEELENA